MAKGARTAAEVRKRTATRDSLKAAVKRARSDWTARKKEGAGVKDRLEVEYRGHQVFLFEDLFEVVRYPSKETHVRLIGAVGRGPVDVIASNVRTFDDLMHVVSADRVLGGARWFIPYFPFARDDRRNTPDDGFELGIAMEMIKGTDVTILDPHSDVAGQMPHIDQCEVARRWQQRIYKADGTFVRIVPDLGAAKKRIPAAETAQCHKKRDPRTGTLSGFAIIEGAEHIKDRHCIIIDDICDGGGTFLGLAKVIREHKPKRLDLAVTHGLFTQGTKKLHEAFDDIYTTGTAPDGVYAISHELIWKRHNAT